MDLKQYLISKLKKRLPPQIFLSNLRIADPEYLNIFEFNDFSYLPFYYWLGTAIQPTNIIEIGFRFGLLSANFLKACKSVEKFLAIQEIKKNEYYSFRLGHSNIRDFYKKKLYIHVGKVNDDAFQIRLKSNKFDLCMINEETTYDKYRNYFDIVWSQINVKGLIVVNYLKKHKASKKAFDDFCLSININPILINTTYGIGIIEKVK